MASKDVPPNPLMVAKDVTARVFSLLARPFSICIVCAAAMNAVAATTTNFPPIGTNPVYNMSTVMRVGSNTIITPAGATNIVNALNALGSVFGANYSGLSNASPDYLTLTNFNAGNNAMLIVSPLNLTNLGAWLAANIFDTRFLSGTDWHTWLATNLLVSPDVLAAATNALMFDASNTFYALTVAEAAFLRTTNDFNSLLTGFGALGCSNAWAAPQSMPGLMLTNTYLTTWSWQHLYWMDLWNYGSGTAGGTNITALYPISIAPGESFTLAGYPQTNTITSVDGMTATVLDTWTQDFSNLSIYWWCCATITNVPQLVFPTGTQTSPFLADWYQITNPPSLNFDVLGSAATVQSNLANNSVNANSLFVAGSQIPAANLSNAPLGVSFVQATQTIVNILATNRFCGGNVVGTGGVLNASVPVAGVQFAFGNGSQTTNAGIVTLAPTPTNGANMVNANATSIFGSGVIPSGFLPAGGMRFWKTVSTGSTNYAPLNIYPPLGTRYLRICGLLGCPNNATAFGFNDDINGQQYVCAIYEINSGFNVWLQGSYCGGIPTTAGWRSGFGHTQQWDVVVYNMSGMPGALHGVNGQVWGASLDNTNYTHFIFGGYWTNSISDITNVWMTVGSNCVFDLFMFP